MSVKSILSEIAYFKTPATNDIHTLTALSKVKLKTFKTSIA